MSIIIMILLLSLLILVHEAGHFFAARAFGIRVDKFGFGLPIGPTLYHKKFGDLEILVHAFLLGGYVSFPDDDKDCDLPEDSPERFINKPKWQRAIVVSAGVIANVICAIVLVMFVALYTGQLPSGNYEISVADIVAPKTAPIWNSGLQKGDLIYSINGCEIHNSYALKTIIQNSAKSNGKVTEDTIEKNYNKLKALNPGLVKDEIIPKNVSLRLPKEPERDVITMDKYAAKGAKYFKKEGITVDEKLNTLKEQVSDKTVYTSSGEYTLYDVAVAISDGAHPINMQVLRNGEKVDIKTIYPNKEGYINILLAEKKIMIPTKNPVSIITESHKYLWANTYTMVYSLGQLFTGNVPAKEMHSIIAITKIGGDVIDRAGKSAGILLAALISMNLALINILPIPALDGGHLMFLLIEKLAGKPLDDKIVEKISSVFFMLLIALMVFFVFNDIVFIVK
ncbi:MAG: RIP metalloprotease RseP [bacterium]|nr:RIP metalloprotease RseP [bacterium]